MTIPAAAAVRQQTTVDALAAELVSWGCPADTALDRARQLLDVVLAHGYALPVALTDGPPARGVRSTREGRAHARRVFDQTRIGCPCGPDIVGGPPDWHVPGCPVLVPREAVEAAASGVGVDTPPLER
jgi:hypothetical protein